MGFASLVSLRRRPQTGTKRIGRPVVRRPYLCRLGIYAKEMKGWRGPEMKVITGYGLLARCRRRCSRCWDDLGTVNKVTSTVSDDGKLAHRGCEVGHHEILVINHALPFTGCTLRYVAADQHLG